MGSATTAGAALKNTSAGLQEQFFKLDIWWDGYSAI